VLAFRRPLARLQLVEGGTGRGKHAGMAVIRELAEEAGDAARAARRIEAVDLAERWHSVAVETGPPPVTWVRRCTDDGGPDFGVLRADGPGRFAPPCSDIPVRIA